MKDAIGDLLFGTTKDLIDIESISRNEGEICTYLFHKMEAIEGYHLERIGNNLVLTSKRYDSGRGMILAGHLDTVPSFGEVRAIVDGDSIYGLGAVDMKSGLAVMLALAEIYSGDDNLRFIFYASEEISRSFSGLLEIERENPELLRGAGAVLLEPTGGFIEAGCQGTARFKVGIKGRRSHSARAWMGVNAIERSWHLLSYLDKLAHDPIEYGGVTYRPALVTTKIEGGIAGNVVPDYVELTVNLRYAPSVSDQSTIAHYVELLESQLKSDMGDFVEVLESAPSAPPSLDNGVIAALGKSGVRGVRAKLGWTDVAFFYERGIPAVNFGPGDPELAHTKDEVVSRDEIVECFQILARLLEASKYQER
ncbi:MAG: succinyl-diaminopimelate desuccinylase [Actinomycetota bacterium]|nr:succinyl-diaminopimelate desuccinylase [Actinomycetota bacterium]